MKKFVIFSSIVVLSCFITYKYMFLIRNIASLYKVDGISYTSTLDSKNFYIYSYGRWKKSFIKGVNIGAGKPGTFPGELAITKAEYLRWFKEIAAMNADYIRVYTILNPDFYNALYEYNKNSIKPLYVFQGVWVNEDDVAKYKNAFSPSIINGIKADIDTLVDIIHGKAKLQAQKGHANGIYTKDVSQYVIGWILGVEWDPDFVVNTNKLNYKITYFGGRYLYTKDASPFEVFLSEIGDFAIASETEKYKMQRPVSFTNWVTTDPLKHPNEPFPNEDLVEVNTEHIKKTASFKPGLFASYHIYPYYPDFMNYQHEYASYIDKNGKINTYEAYLKDLRKMHTIPVLVAEFGIPAARGMAHRNIYMNYNQGDVDEVNQGKMETTMLENIYDEDYAGGLIFSWQDEWFKRTWNTMDLDLPDRRPYWSNSQTNEQQFGLLAFDTGIKKSICYIDGDTSDWKNDKVLLNTSNMKLYAKSDEKYIYIMVDIKNFSFEKDKLIIPIDITPNSGSLKYNELNITFNRPTDMIIFINKSSNSNIMIDSYYDVFYYIYAKKNNMIDENKNYEIKNNGIFNPIYLCLNKSMYLPQDKKNIPLSKYETGKLVIGDANPGHKSFNSLADYALKDNKLEIKIPWQLLNVMDPSSKMIMDDFHEKNKITSLKIEGMYIGGVLIKNDNAIENNNMEFYTWKEWEIPTYHERLKPSYYILKKSLKTIGKK